MSDIVKEVPFHSQHWNLDDWQALGFSDRADAEYWQRSCCGVLCLQMIVEYFLHKKLSLIGLIHQGQQLGAYTDALGWSHEGLVRLAKENGISAEQRQMKPEDLRLAIDKNAIPIISIKWAFRLTKTIKEKILFWKKYGGHLAVVVGYRVEEGKVMGFYVHHTSKISEQNWISRYLPLAFFQAGYTGRAIVVHQPT